MKYISTRNKNESISSSQAIIKGLSESGGLFVPENIPKVADIDKLIDMDYKELAYTIMEKFFTDFDKTSLENLIEKAYDDKFDSKEIAPLAETEGLFYLELFHGPTFAFKDMALSILPYLLKEAIKNTGEKKR